MQRLRNVYPMQIGITIILLYSIMPIVSRFISTYLTTYSYMLLVVLIVFVIVTEDRMNSVNFYFSALLPLIIYESLTLFTRTDSLVLWGYQVVLFLLPVILGYFVFYCRSEDYIVYFRIMLIALLITAVTTIIGVIQYPNAARTLATVSSQDPEAILFDWHNIGGFGFVYSLVLLYPILILAYKRRKISFIRTIAITILIFAVAVFTEYTTAFLMLIITSFLFFTKKEFSLQGVILLVIAEVLIVILFNEVISSLLTMLGNAVNSETISERLTALAGGTDGLEASDDNRISLYRTSIQTFFRHPLLGTFLTGGGGIGGHSFLLDTLAQYGLLGAFVLFFSYRKIYLVFYQIYHQESGFGYVLWAFMQTLLLSCVNTGMWLIVLAFYMPIILLWVFEDEKGIKKFENEYPAASSL